MKTNLNSKVEKNEFLKGETCRDFRRGYCKFYSAECFHDDKEPLGFNRCYRLIPRKENELMEWMNDICSDCNEPVCNDCHVYIEYNFRKSW